MSEPIKIRANDVVNWFNNTSESVDPDYVYDNGDGMCYYVHDVEDSPVYGGDLGDLSVKHHDVLGADFRHAVPGCIVAHFFHHMGVPLDVLHSYEHCPADILVENLIGDEVITVQNRYGIGSFLVVVQSHQDRGKTWREAIRLAASSAPAPVK